LGHAAIGPDNYSQNPVNYEAFGLTFAEGG
jgi:hypothetical protein